MKRGVRWTIRWLTLGAAVVLGVAISGSAQGFYFKGWPGDGIPKDKILVNPKAPPYENPPIPPPGSETEPPQQNPPGNPPPNVPEPATGLAAMVGLAVLGVAHRLRRRRIG